MQFAADLMPHPLHHTVSGCFCAHCDMTMTHRVASHSPTNKYMLFARQPFASACLVLLVSSILLQSAFLTKLLVLPLPVLVHIHKFRCGLYPKRPCT